MAQEDEPIVAVALLTQTNLRMLKGSLKRVFPLPQDGKFDALLQALDDAAAARSIRSDQP